MIIVSITEDTKGRPLIKKGGLKRMIDYLIGRKGYRKPLWVFCVITFFLVLVFEVIDLLTSLF